MGEWNGNGMGDLGNWKMGEWKILFRWKIKWRLELLGALGIMGDPFKCFCVFSDQWRGRSSDYNCGTSCAADQLVQEKSRPSGSKESIANNRG